MSTEASRSMQQQVDLEQVGTAGQRKKAHPITCASMGTLLENGCRHVVWLRQRVIANGCVMDVWRSSSDISLPIAAKQFASDSAIAGER